MFEMLKQAPRAKETGNDLRAWPQLTRSESEGWLGVRDDFRNWVMANAA